MIKNKNKMNIWRGTSVVCALLASLIGCITPVAFENVGAINGALGITTTPAISSDGEIYYPSDYGPLNSKDTLDKIIADAYEYNIRTMQEGAVLLKNEKSALPLKEEDGKKVTLFGRASADPVYRAASGGAYVGENVVDLRSALEAKGYTINDALFNAYKNSTTKRVGGTSSNYAAVEPGTNSIGEESIEFYTDTLRDSFAQYGDIAIVFLARTAGEGTDMQKVDADGVSQLSLHKQEADMLKMVKSYKGNGLFKKVIVLLNAGNPMEVEWLNDEQYGVDACLWIGQPGVNGLTGVADILTGAANPSGRTVDTYATDSLSAPATQNQGDFNFSNMEDTYKGSMSSTNNDSKYVIYAESIYVGYKYYETRYEEAIMGNESASGDAGVFASGSGWNYADEVSYPFGYGLSYTTFSQTLDSVAVDWENQKVTATVSTTNTGEVPGKAVVQFYAQLPYTEENKRNLVEKSSIQLFDFAKTDVIDPQETVTTTIECDMYLLATYDSTANNGEGGYIFDAGKYYFAIGDNSHDALNNILAAKNYSGLYDEANNPVDGDAAKAEEWTLEECDSSTYRNSQYTGEVVSNRFEFADLNTFIPDKVTYLTRQDWNTFPVVYNDVERTDEMAEQMKLDEYTVPAEQKDLEFSDFRQGAKSEYIPFVALKDIEKDDDETWEKFLDQLTLEDLYKYTSDSFGSPICETVARPATANNDGPDGWKDTYSLTGENCTCYVCETVLASTWNKDLARERGYFFAEEALFRGGSQMWAPGANMHRTPYGGRNFEYFSEDSILSYHYVYAEVKQMQEKGLMSALKHFVANDQETNRLGVATFMTEQTLRQGPMKAFESAFTKAGALGTMTSYNRIGCIPDHCCGELLNEVLRGEWGFKGMTITDAQTPTSIEHAIYAMQNGTDMWCMSGKAYTFYKRAMDNKNAYGLYLLRNANKNMFYSYSRSNLINGLSEETVLSDSLFWWQSGLIALTVIFSVAAVGFAGVYVWTRYIRKPKREGNV